MIVKNLMRLACSAILFAVITSSVQAVVIFNDSFADGDFAKTGALDTNWWTSSSSSGKEISPGSLGLVTGTSGRGIHTVFPTQTLANVGDSLIARYTFMTPATVGSGSTAFKVGFFDGLGQAGLDADVNASSSSPNALYGWGPAVVPPGPGTQALPGFFMDMDINTGAGADLNFRTHDQGTPFASGRLMQTNNNFSSVSPSGPDEGYTFDPSTQYTGSLQVTRISATEIEMAGSIGTVSYSNTTTFDSVNFDFFGFHVNSNRFGSTNQQNMPDNGIDFSNINLEFLPVPEPSSLALILPALLFLRLGGRKK